MHRIAFVLGVLFLTAGNLTVKQYPQTKATDEALKELHKLK